MTHPLPINEIVSNPDLHDGQPSLAGTKLLVSDIIAWGKGQPVEDVAAFFNITLGQVYAAFAYYYLNRDEIDAVREQNARKAQTITELIEDDDEGSPA